MRRASLSVLLAFSLLVFHPLLPQIAAQYPGSSDSRNSSGNDSGYWSTPPDRDMAQSYPPPSYDGSPYGNGQNQPPDGSAPDNRQADQEHGVARLSIVDGEVNVRRGDTGEAIAAAINAPLLTQDHLQTSSNGRAEMELDSGDVLRVAPNAELNIAALQFHRAQLQLGLGSVLYRVLRSTASDVEIDTPSVGFRADGTGEFRLSVYDDGTTQITVRSGTASVLSANGREQLNAGQSLLARGEATHPEFQWVSPPALDQLEGWSRDRDRQMLESQSNRYVNPDVGGADDLDRYGSWVPSQYGQVWQPQEPNPDWAPYTAGDWTYEPYYGWTWVDTAPWGWAPYHYGRWFVNGSRWCWWPGGIGASAYWSPALVGFFGIGAGLGWVALAPFESFHPWWGIGFHGGWGGYRGGSWGGYRNAGFRGGAVFAAPGQFGSHNGRYGFADRSQLSRATFINGRLPVTPGRSSYAFSNRAAFSSQRPSFGNQRGFYRSPAASGGWGRSDGNRSDIRRGLGSTPSSHSNQQVGTPGGWHNFGDPGRASAARQNFAGAQSSEAWHNFGQAGHSWSQAPAGNQQRPSQGWQQPHGQPPSYGASYTAPRSAPGGTGRGSATWSGAYSSPGNGGSGGYRSFGSGFGSYATPRANTPRSSAGGASPHYSQPHAGSSSGGGGGHTSHSEGGHSSGGGGHHH